VEQITFAAKGHIQVGILGHCRHELGSDTSSLKDPTERSSPPTADSWQRQAH